MKLLIDEDLPPRLAGLLTDAGHDTVHVRNLDAACSPDPQILDLVLADGRTIVSADTDFGALLASAGATAPSVILVREVVDRRPPELTELLTACIEQLEAQLHSRQRSHRRVRRSRRRLIGCPLPSHVGLIMDGNRRWARQAGLNDPILGHRHGASHVSDLLGWCETAGIRHLTLFVCSTENLQRRADQKSPI